MTLEFRCFEFPDDRLEVQENDPVINDSVYLCITEGRRDGGSTSIALSGEDAVKLAKALISFVEKGEALP